jgi:glucosamine--fructose-6-phosphate aminotransferase (isomerizing)
MCGIVGILGREPVAEQLVDSLKRLEYRGYDSAGVATLEGKHLERRRAEGKLKNLEKRLEAEPLKGTTGIGHTRWATHGKPTVNNAHPHATERVAVVHNGIIENFRELREELEKKGTVFHTQTDTEIVLHLVDDLLTRGNKPVEAVKLALARLRGAFALGFIFAGEDDLMIGARNGPPLAIGYGDGEMYLGSDAIALGPFTDTISYLEDGDWVVLTHTSAAIFDKDGHAVQREKTKHAASTSLVDKANYRHFMAKEIHEQPEVVGHTLARYVDMATERVSLPVKLPFDFKNIQRINITACGTASYAGFVAKYWFERFARVPVEVDVASEFRYREAPLRKGDLAIFISQSGETADTLAALREAKRIGYLGTLAICNVPASSLVREADMTLMTRAGPEIGVASTKAFTTQLAALALFGIALARQRGLKRKLEEIAVRQLMHVPHMIEETLKLEPQIKEWAKRFVDKHHALFLGRGASWPIAMEGALKLKEISYIHAEAYAAGELKHGPLALVDDDRPVVAVAPNDALLEKLESNLQEVRARGGRLFVFADPKSGFKPSDGVEVIHMPEHVEDLQVPLVYTIPLQLLSYHVAVLRGTDVDKPRNLAKSVTVE